MKLYQELSHLFHSLIVVGHNPNHDQQHASLQALLTKYIAPSPSIFKASPRMEKCSREHIVLHVEYNHAGDPEMGDNEFWTIHQVVIEPSFIDTLTIDVRGTKMHEAREKVEAYLRGQLMMDI